MVSCHTPTQPYTSLLVYTVPWVAIGQEWPEGHDRPRSDSDGCEDRHYNKSTAFTILQLLPGAQLNRFCEAASRWISVEQTRLVYHVVITFRASIEVALRTDVGMRLKGSAKCWRILIICLRVGRK